MSLFIFGLVAIVFVVLPIVSGLDVNISVTFILLLIGTLFVYNYVNVSFIKNINFYKTTIQNSNNSEEVICNDSYLSYNVREHQIRHFSSENMLGELVDYKLSKRWDINKTEIDFPWLGVCLLAIFGVLSVFGALGSMVYLILCILL